MAKKNETFKEGQNAGKSENSWKFLLRFIIFYLYRVIVS